VAKTKRTAALLLLADGQPGFDRRDRARPVLEPRDGDELPRATLIGLAFADRDDQKTRPAEVEVLDVERGDLGAPPPRGERKQQDRPIADSERGRRRSLEFDACGEPLRGNRGAAVVAAGVFAAGALEQVADHALIGR
jgi:hypothetical protein